MNFGGKIVLIVALLLLAAAAMCLFCSRERANGRKQPEALGPRETPGGTETEGQKKEQALQADIAALAGEYRAAYLRYALHDEA